MLNCEGLVNFPKPIKTVVAQKTRSSRGSVNVCLHTAVHLGAVAFLSLSISPLEGAIKPKASNPQNLNRPGSWTSGAPTAADIAVWDATVTAANTAAIGGNLSWLGLQILNPGGLVTINGTNNRILTLGASGIAMTAATQDLTLNCALKLGANQVWDIASSRLVTSSGVISGTGSLTKNGVGTALLTGINTYIGQTVVNGGVLQINNAGSLGATSSIATIQAATLQLLSGKIVSTSRNFKLGNAASTIQIDSGASMTISGAISNAGTSGSLIKTGTGTLILSAAAGNTYGGAGHTTAINGGTLQIGADNLLGISANTVTFQGGTLLLSAGITSARNISLIGAGTINTNNNTASLSGVISGAGNLTKSGTGTLTLSGTNSYSGGTTVTGGNLSVLSLSGAGNAGSSAITLSGGSAILGTANFTFSNGLILGATGGSAQPDGTLVSGMINVAGGTTLTLSGVGISEVTSGTGRLEKLGTGTLVVNTANSYAGGTYIHEGTFVSGNATALGSTSNQLTIDNGAQLKLSISGVFRRNVLIGTGGGVFGATTTSNVAYRNGVISNVNAQSGGVTLASGVNGFGGANTFSGSLIIQNGAVAGVSRDVNFGAAANQIFLNGGGTLRIEDGIDITPNGGTTANAVLATFSTARQITLGIGAATIEVKNFADTNSSFDNSSSNPIVPAGGRPASHPNTLTLSGLLTGEGSLVKAGDGMLVLTNIGNNYTGGTTINAGTLSIADASAIGGAANPLTINAGGIFQSTASFTTSRVITLGGSGGSSSGGTIDVTGANLRTHTGVIDGTGSLIKTGTGVLSLSGTNTYSGGTYVFGGTVSVTSGQSLGLQPSLGSGLYAVHLGNGTTLQTAVNSVGGNRQLELMGGTATLDIGAGFTQQRNALVYGAGGLVKAGAGVGILAAANTYSGGTVINAGIFQVNNTSGSATGTGSVTVNNSGTLSALPTANGFANAGSVSGAVTVNGGGSLLARSNYTFNLGGLTLNTSAISDFQLGAATNLPVINITGTNAFSLAGLSTVNIGNPIGGLTIGTYRLFDYSGTALTSITNLQLGSTPGLGYTYSLSNNTTDTSVDLLVSTSNVQWANDINGNWNVTSNWTNAVVPNAVGAQANFFGAIKSARTVTVDGAFTIGTMTFSNANTYTIASNNVVGSGLTLSNGGTASISVLNGSHIISAPITLANNLEITAATNTSLTASGTIGESFSARTTVINGGGTVTFAGAAANTYTGLTTVGSGSLNLAKTSGVNAIGIGGLRVDAGSTASLQASNQIADVSSVNINGTLSLGTNSETIGALNGGGSVILGAGSLLTVGASNNLNSQYNGVISGAGTIAKNGSGTWIINGANTFGGAGTTVGINGGNLQINTDASLGNSNNSLTFNNGTLVLSGGLTNNRGIILAGNGTMNTNNISASLSGVVSGAGSFTKAGAGNLTLSGTNTYAGGTNINGGSLSVASDANLGQASGTVTFNNGAALITSADISFNRGVTLGTSGGTFNVAGVFDVAAGTTFTQNTGSVISGNRLMKDGAGTLDLRGSNTYSGGTYLHNGTLVINSSTSFGQIPNAGDPFLAALTIDNGATLRAGISLVAYPGRGLYIGNGGAVLETGLGITYFRNGPMENVAGQSGGLTKTGLGTQGLGGTNAFVGNVNVNSGVLSVSRDANLGAAANQVFLGAGSTLRIEDGINNYGATPQSAVFATFATNRQINLVAGSATIEVKNFADTNPSFDGSAPARPASHENEFTVGGTISGAGALIKSGDGTLVIANSANSYSGGTTINGGILSVAEGGALGGSGNLLTINPTATFRATGSFISARAVLLGGLGGASSGGTFDVTAANNETRTGTIDGNGSLTKTGTGTLSLFGVNTYTGSSYLNSGITAVNSISSLGNTSGSATIGNATLQVVSDITSTRNFTINHLNSTLQIDSGATYSLSGVLSGSGALNKTGEGVLLLSNANTYTGGTNINGGTVVVNGPNSFGIGGPLTINAGTLLVAMGYTTTRNITLGNIASTIEVNPSQTYTVSGVVSGSGVLTKTGTGNLTLTNTNTFVGDTVVNDGTLVAASTNVGGSLATTATVTVNDAGTLLLGADNEINDVASITLNAGTIAKGNFSEGTAATVGMGALTLVAAGSNLDFGTGTVGVLSFSSFISNAEILVIDGWTGNVNTMGTSSTDRLIFNSSQSANLNNFAFSGFSNAAQFSLGNGFYEITPLTAVPEPSTYAAGALSLLAVAFHQRRKLRRGLVAARRFSFR